MDLGYVSFRLKVALFSRNIQTHVAQSVRKVIPHSSESNQGISAGEYRSIGLAKNSTWWNANGNSPYRRETSNSLGERSECSGRDGVFMGTHFLWVGSL